VTQRGQYLDFTHRRGGCTLYAGIDGNPVIKTVCGCPKTHVVKWQADQYGPRLRHYTCAHHAATIIAAQHKLGAVCRAYRIRKGQR